MEIKPCPFCGEKPSVHPAQDGSNLEMIECGNDACPVVPATDYLELNVAVAAWNTRQPVTIQEAADGKVMALIDGLIASSVELRKRVTSPKRTKYLLGRIEGLKDLKADIRALAAPDQGAE